MEIHVKCPHDNNPLLAEAREEDGIIVIYPETCERCIERGIAYLKDDISALREASKGLVKEIIKLAAT